MEAVTFISSKHAAAVAELKAIEAEYRQRLEKAQAAIKMTRRLLDELDRMPVAKEPVLTVETPVRKPSEQWVSSRDLLPKVRLAS